MEDQNVSKPAAEETLPEVKVPKKPMAPEDMKLKMVVGGSIILAVAAAGFILLSDDKKENPANKETDNETTDSYMLNDEDILESVDYKDGSYYTEAKYFVPASGKTDTIGVTVVIKDNKIISLEVDDIVDGEIVESERNDTYNEKLSGIVVGKTIGQADDLTLVSGSTLTNEAFVEALRGIADNAQ